MASVPVVDPTKVPAPSYRETVTENPSAGCCMKHCHYPIVQTGMYTAPSGVTEGCVCMENRRDCDFEWEENGRGFCRNCHHASSLTVKASDCKLDF